MILQPLVENSLKHAIAVSESGGHIRIVASEPESNSDALLLKVEDSGPEASDREARQSTPGSSLGLENTKARLTAFLW